MTAFWSFPYGQDPEDPDAIDVTGFGDPVRSFISLRDPTSAECAEFRATWLIESAFLRCGPPLTGVPRERDPDSVQAIRDPPRAATPRACRDCGMDDLPRDYRGRCAYCAELAGLKARNLPGPRLSGWWMMIPAALAVALGTALLYAVLAVVLAG